MKGCCGFGAARNHVGELMFLQALVEGIDPILRNGPPALQETVARAGRIQAVAVRGRTKFECES